MAIEANVLSYDDIEDNVRAVLAETTESFWKSTQIIAWTDEAVRDLVLRLPDDCLYGMTDIALTATADGTESYALPVDFVRLKMVRIQYATAGKDMLPAKLIDPSDLYEYVAHSNKKPKQESPICWMFDSKIWLDPVPEAIVADGLEVWYVREPLQYKASGDEPEVKEVYRPLIVWYVLSRALDKGRESGMANKYQQLYDQGVQQAWSTYYRLHKQEERGKRK